MTPWDNRIIGSKICCSFKNEIKQVSKTGSENQYQGSEHNITYIVI